MSSHQIARRLRRRGVTHEQVWRTLYKSQVKEAVQTAAQLAPCEDFETISTLDGRYTYIRKHREAAPGDVQHETWLEYHDRLVREYYDVEAEWALIKEICPELDRPEPRQEDPVFGPLARGTVAAAKGLAVSGLIFGLIAWWVWLMVGWFS